MSSPETIEHFRPKGRDRFPERAFEWENLFYCCQACQGEKREQFDELLLKPDGAAYSFERYFVCAFTTGEILPSPAADERDRERARKTLELYGLNRCGRPADRLRQIRLWISRSAGMELGDFPYRGFLALVVE